MKIKISALTFILLFAHALSAQSFMKSLGKPILNSVSECACADNDGNLTIGYYNLKDTLRDTLYLSKWNVSSKSWTFINKIPIKNEGRNYSKCIYKDDSLLVFAKLKGSGSFNSNLIFVNNKEYKTIGNFRLGKSNGIISDLKQINKGIIIFGNFDSVRVNTNSAKVQHMTLYNGLGFENLKTPTEFGNYPISDIPIASNNDTFLLISGGVMVWQYIYPNKWNVIAKSTKPVFSGLAHNGHNWIITRENSDSLMFFNGKTITYKLLKQKLNPPLMFANTNQGLILSEGGKQGKLFRYDPVKNAFINIYHSFRNDTIRRNIVFSNSKIYYISTTPLIYRNENYGKIVELNINSSMPVEYDTISVFAFNDLNYNNKLDNGENLVQATALLNKTYMKISTSSSGYFKEIVPDYNDVELEIKNLQRCFQVPLYFKTQYSKNTKPGVKHDSLYFPVQENKLPQNLIIKSFPLQNKARMMDTIPLEIDLKSNDCNIFKSNTIITLILDSNTTIINSNPAYTSISKNVITYDFTYVSTENPFKIKINVVYSNLKYKIDDVVKHYVTLNTDFVEDTSDNKDSIVQKLVYSYDPNAKSCEPTGNVSGDVKNIRYFIEFQNEGTDDARRVTVVDTLDVHIPVYEFQMIASSHSYNVNLKGNVVTWIFDNINLPPKTVSENASKGFIIFEARLYKSLGVGDSVKNKAYIYFDYNTPIITNTASVIKKSDIVEPPDVDGKLSIKVYPNPANEIVVFENVSVKSQQVKVYNMIGQEISTFDINPSGIINKSIIDWPRGMYFIKSSKGSFHKFLIH